MLSLVGVVTVVTYAIMGAVVSVVVVVVSSVVPVVEYSSLSSPQEMTEKLKQEIKKMNKTFFIFPSIPKVKYYWLGEPNIYQNLGDFSKILVGCGT